MPEREVRVFVCETCGQVLLSRMMPGSNAHYVSQGGGLGTLCGPITERILVDRDQCRRETIEECAKFVERDPMCMTYAGYLPGKIRARIEPREAAS